MEYKFCPGCKSGLNKMQDGGVGCPECRFAFYNNPHPVAVNVVKYHDGILMVKRKNEPKKGGWCLPAGFVNPYEAPDAAALRELKEETNIDGQVIGLLDARNPHPGRTNQVVLFYEVKPLHRNIIAGDDALEARVFMREKMPEICFHTHQETVDDFYRTLDHRREMLREVPYDLDDVGLVDWLG